MEAGKCRSYFAPRCWPCRARVARRETILIHKKGSKDDIKNYRPISLTCLVMKLFEKNLKEELLLRTSNLLDYRQHGFLSLKSCSTNMVNFTDNVVMSINDTQTLSTDVVTSTFQRHLILLTTI